MSKTKEDKIDKIKNIIVFSGLTGVEMKVFMYLIDVQKTQAQLSREITDVSEVAIKKAVQVLVRRDMLLITAIEGRNKFLTANINTKIEDKNQVKLKWTSK